MQPRSALQKQAIRRTKETDVPLKRILALLEELKAGSRYTKRLMVGKNGRSVFIEISQINWFEAQGNYVRVHSGQTQHVLRRSIGRLESCLDPDSFLRVNRSAIVNIDQIRELQHLSHGDVRLVLDGGTELTVSRNYRKNLERLLGEE